MKLEAVFSYRVAMARHSLSLDDHAMELLDLYVVAERDRSAFRFRIGSGE